MKRRTNKFYNDNEKKIMQQLGFNPQPASGSGWIYKEDGENDFALAQLKSTDCESYSLSLVEINKLLYHANISNKLPLFIIEFINKQTLITVRLEDLNNFAQLILNGEFNNHSKISKLEGNKIKRDKIITNKEGYIEEPRKEETKQPDTLEETFRKRQERKQQEQRRREQREKYKKKV